MDIEWTMEGEQDVHEMRPEERQIVPIGTHRMTIKAAEVGPNEYRTSDTNPDGICLKLRLELDRGHKLVFHDLPQHQPWMAGQLARALGIQPDGSKLRLSPESVIGQTVIAMVEHYTSKAGKISAVIKRYLEPNASPVAAAKLAAAPKATKPRQPAAKTVESFDDDIPF